jgi:hypothetical protein
MSCLPYAGKASATVSNSVCGQAEGLAVFKLGGVRNRRRELERSGE